MKQIMVLCAMIALGVALMALMGTFNEPASTLVQNTANEITSLSGILAP